MHQYIMFNDNYSGVNGYVFEKGVKYKIKSSDTNFYYVMSDKIKIDKANILKYEVGQIQEGR